MFNKHDISRDTCQLFGHQAKVGYDWWWHSFTAYHHETGEERQFFLEFFLVNPKSGMDKPIFGQLEENKKQKIKPSYLMIKVGTWGDGACQLHAFYGWNNIEVNYGKPFSIKASDNFLTEDSSKGSLTVTKEEALNHPEMMSDAGSISWNLKVKKDISFNVGYGASKVFRKLQLFNMFWHAEGMKSYYSGSITFNGETYDVIPEKSYGYADKNWGKDFTSPWVWLSSNNLVSLVTGKKLNNSVFDIGGGCPKVGPFAFKRKLLSAIYFEGQEFEFNFSKFWTHTKTKFNCYETADQIVWHVEQTARHDKMIADITCLKKDMLLVKYESPTGEFKHNRLYNGGNGIGTLAIYHKGTLVDKWQCANVGCEYGEYNHEGPYLNKEIEKFQNN